ncbi:lambda-crystallin homolog [Micropterus dolomieu]|uniref:lambda-crystallin homolog n=1 Tax=Micropterus dolomieu TaxID=147949 RepID=UPI001E8D8EE4|nr:lambda-crystallin homolog [Micropterus dolomieu]
MAMFSWSGAATCSERVWGYEAYACANQLPPTGLEDYMKRYGEGIRRVLTSFGPVPDFFGEGAKSIVSEMCELIPSDEQHLSARIERRDQLLMGLAKLKKEH